MLTSAKDEDLSNVTVNLCEPGLKLSVRKPFCGNRPTITSSTETFAERPAGVEGARYITTCALPIFGSVLANGGPFAPQLARSKVVRRRRCFIIGER
jgi:hypothetical protein